MSVNGIGATGTTMAALQRQLNDQQRAQTQSDGDADSSNGGPRSARIPGLGSPRDTGANTAPPATPEAPGVTFDGYL